MNSKTMVIIIFLIIAFVIIFYGYNNASNKICFEDFCFTIDIADDNLERQKGLMFREELCFNCGMLFVFEQENNYKFWMKNTLIPLDIIWMNKNFVIQYIAYDVPPCEIEDCPFYSPPKEIKSKYILEVNSGIARKLGLLFSKKMFLK
ncbi:MAG: DUF192 domain-containing protein [Nanoarchaeota archaeon]